VKEYHEIKKKYEKKIFGQDMNKRKGKVIIRMSLMPA
jgi:hypothetical protein